MNQPPELQPTEDAQVLRSMLRTDLVAAMKARQPEIVAALRTAIAAIDNAEAVEVPDRTGVVTSKHIAGAQAGVGSTEAKRRALTIDDVRALLQAEIADRTAEADRYDTHGHHEAASRLRHEAEALRKYLTTGHPFDVS
jgi:uncharacterized protein YqeY